MSHGPKIRTTRFDAVDERGRVVALIAEGPDASAAAWTSADGAGSFMHHSIDGDVVGAPNLTACSAAISVLNGAHGVDVASQPWAADRVEVYRHLAAHLMEAGVAMADLPQLAGLGADDAMALLLWIDECYAAQAAGLGAPPDNEAALEEERRLAESTAAQAAVVERTTPIGSKAELEAKLAQIRERQAQRPTVERMAVIASIGGEDVALDLPVRWDPEAIDPLAFDPATGTFGTLKGAFVSTLEDSDAFAMTAAGADVAQIVDNPGGAWHAILCVEGLRTDEDPGREIMPGACQFPDLPVSLRLQIHDEGGHWGAVTCGRIDTMDREDMGGYNAIAATGVFGTDEHGQTAQLLVEEQTQRFISIDPRNVTMEIVEIEITTSGLYDEEGEDPDLYDWWYRYSELTIGAATIVATPALQQAVIAPASMELPETPIAVENAPPSSVILASGDDSLPHLEDFADPGFHVGDPRLVRQADGHYACPLTVVGREVFGHIAYWSANHTGFPGKSRKPPHSPTYAYFMTGARDTAEGTKVPVGNLTMGCGHASTAIRSAESAKAHYTTPTAPAHYDGGYGAVQMADVSAGEDDFGIWVHGVLCDGVTQEQVTRFESMGASGDWREIAGKLHLVAALAVPVPGFPIAREDVLVAAAAVIDEYAVRAGLNDAGDVFSLVAAGRVRRQSAEERLAVIEGILDELTADLRTRNAKTTMSDLSALVEG